MQVRNSDLGSFVGYSGGLKYLSVGGAPLFIHLTFLKFINQLFLPIVYCNCQDSMEHIVLVTDTLSNGLFDLGRYLSSVTYL